MLDGKFFRVAEVSIGRNNGQMAIRVEPAIQIHCSRIARRNPDWKGFDCWLQKIRIAKEKVEGDIRQRKCIARDCCSCPFLSSAEDFFWWRNRSSIVIFRKE